MSLPEQQRTAVLLAGLTRGNYYEVATACDVPVGTIRSGLALGRKTLRELTNVAPPQARISTGREASGCQVVTAMIFARFAAPLVIAAAFQLSAGASASESDRVDARFDQGMKLGCNHPIGPLALADMIGLDALLAVMQTIHDEFADSKYRPCPLLKEMVAAGYLGHKTGRGVYRY